MFFRIEEVSVRFLFMDKAIITDILEGKQSAKYLINAHPVEVSSCFLVAMLSTQETLNGWCSVFEAKEKKNNSEV